MCAIKAIEWLLVKPSWQLCPEFDIGPEILLEQERRMKRMNNTGVIVIWTSCIALIKKSVPTQSMTENKLGVVLSDRIIVTWNSVSYIFAAC